MARPGLSKRRYTALYVCKHIGENLDDEIVGHVYLFLKEQLQMPPLSGVLHGTIIGDPIVQGLIKSNGRVFERLFTDFRDCLNHVEYSHLPFNQYHLLG
ncbi:uncharacterized protein LOC107014262 isoform X2 [Solanum pennellii]|uniref:Uncharacterized protein LOC107014262 isoform X2 n=1 Tax=Solanum pennellii TaxID=28526 RepID=A0ABM1GDK3_SOLPN|nr:uncharacterized protein LOC107014262 isoform X2 [Solanum pennellii]